MIFMLLHSKKCLQQDWNFTRKVKKHNEASTGDRTFIRSYFRNKWKVKFFEVKLSNVCSFKLLKCDCCFFWFFITVDEEHYAFKVTLSKFDINLSEMFSENSSSVSTLRDSPSVSARFSLTRRALHVRSARRQEVDFHPLYMDEIWWTYVSHPDLQKSLLALWAKLNRKSGGPPLLNKCSGNTDLSKKLLK